MIIDQTLSFNNKSLIDSAMAAGATTAVFLLVRKGFITWIDAEKCFTKPQAQWKELYSIWCKANGLDE